MSMGPGQPFEKRVVDEDWTMTIKVRGAQQIRRANERGYFDTAPELKDGSLAEIVIRADTLEQLVARANLHLGILEA